MNDSQTDPQEETSERRIPLVGEVDDLRAAVSTRLMKAIRSDSLAGLPDNGEEADLLQSLIRNVQTVMLQTSKLLGTNAFTNTGGVELLKLVSACFSAATDPDVLMSLSGNEKTSVYNAIEQIKSAITKSSRGVGLASELRKIEFDVETLKTAYADLDAEEPTTARAPASLFPNTDEREERLISLSSLLMPLPSK